MKKEYNKLVLGGAQFGYNYVSKKSNLYKKKDEIIKIFSLGKKYGINKIDTAQCYGRSEENIGCFKKRLSKNIFLITKLDLTNYDKSQENLENFIIKQVFLSLKKLRSKSIDILMIHNFYDLKKYGSNLTTILQKLKKLDLVKELGVSIYTPKELIYSAKFPIIKNIQIPFNIIDTRWNKKTIINLIKKKRIKIFARSIFLKGILINRKKSQFKDKKILKKIYMKLNEYSNKFNRTNRIDVCLSFANSFNWIKYLVIGFNSKKEFGEILNNFNKPRFKKREIKSISNDMSKMIRNKKILTPNLW